MKYKRKNSGALERLSSALKLVVHGQNRIFSTFLLAIRGIFAFK